MIKRSQRRRHHIFIGDIKIIRSLDEACDAEVKRVLMAMPNWQPGKQFGKAVPVYFMLPVQFKKSK